MYSCGARQLTYLGLPIHEWHDRHWNGMGISCQYRKVHKFLLQVLGGEEDVLFNLFFEKYERFRGGGQEDTIGDKCRMSAGPSETKPHDVQGAFSPKKFVFSSWIISRANYLLLCLPDHPSLLPPPWAAGWLLREWVTLMINAGLQQQHRRRTRRGTDELTGWMAVHHFRTENMHSSSSEPK